MDTCHEFTQFNFTIVHFPIPRSIGVSNFGPHQLTELCKGGRPVPAVDQIELHPFWRKENIVEYCLEKGIAVMGYCPLFRGKKNNEPVLVGMAKKYNKTVAQLLIGWSVQKGYITIPKSTNSERITANSQVFDFRIGDEDMKVLVSYHCISYFGQKCLALRTKFT